MGILNMFRKKASDPVDDPVCGMTIERADSAGTSQHLGATVHFCSGTCKRKFDADPSKYAAKL